MFLPIPFRLGGLLRAPCCVLVISFAVCLRAEGLTVRNSPGHELSLADIWSAWDKRQSEIHSAQFEWRHTNGTSGQWHRFQSLYVPRTSFRPDYLTNQLFFNSTGTHISGYRWSLRAFNEFCSFSASNRKAHHRANEDDFHALHFDSCYYSDLNNAIDLGLPGGEEQRRNPRRFDAFICNSVRTDVFDKGTEKYSEAIVRASKFRYGDYVRIADDLIYLPLLLMYRPFHPDFEVVDRSRCEIVNSRTDLNGTGFLTVREIRPDEIVNLFWLDPFRDFVVTRWTTSRSGVDIAQVDISYECGAESGWYPSKWLSMVLEPPGEYPGRDYLALEVSAEVTSVSVNKTPAGRCCSPRAIQPGTFVTDELSDTHFIALFDGRKRVVAAGEAHVGYDHLISSTRGLSRLWMYITCILMAMCSIICGKRVARRHGP